MFLPESKTITNVLIVSVIFISLFTIYRFIEVKIIESQQRMNIQELIVKVSETQNMLLNTLASKAKTDKNETLISELNTSEESFKEFLDAIKVQIAEENIKTVLDKSLINKFISSSAIIIALFTSVFSIFTYLTQLNLTKAERLHTQFKSTNNDIDKKLIELKEVVQSYPGLLSGFKKEKQKQSSRIFSIFNSFLLDDYKLEIPNLYDVLDLWDNQRIKPAIMKLQANNCTKSIPYLEERFRELQSTNPTSENNILLEEAIGSLIAYRDNPNPNNSSES